MTSAPPAELSTFVGRAEELAAVTAEVRRGGLVTLVGPGGIGKTRLAVRAAAGYESGAVHWFDLQAVQAGALLGTVQDALGTVVAPGVEPATAIATGLGADPALLVLDNCEHLLDDLAPLVARIRDRCPAVTILATSRAPLEVAGERVWRVPPLVLADALALFLDRIAGPGRTAPEVARARRVCDQLDRLPLALELAAGWAETLSLEQISAALEQGTLALAGGDRTAPFRQRSLAASMQWSHDLLDAPEQRLLRRLAVFAPGFDADAVAALASAAGQPVPEALLALRRLIATSLVVADTHGAVATYRLLATIQEFALAKLVESGEADAVRAHHLAVHLDRADARAALVATDMDDWRAATRADYPNARAAVDWGLTSADPAPARRLAVRLAPFWETHGEDGLRLLDRAIALGDGTDPVLDAECLVAHGLVAMTALPTGTGVEAAAAALEAAERSGATAVTPLARLLFANALLFVDPPHARTVAEEALAEASAAGDGFVVDTCRFLIGLLAGMADDHPTAVAHLAPATSQLLAHGHRGVASTGAAVLARSAAALGDLAAAVEHARASVTAAEPLHELHRIGIAQTVLSEVLLLVGDVAAATAATDRLDALATADAAHPVFVPGRELTHARLALATGRPAEAVEWCRLGGRWRGAGCDAELDPITRTLLLTALRRAGDTAAAQALAPTLTAEGVPPSARASATAEQAHLAEADQALALHHEALRIRHQHGLVLDCVDSLEALAPLVAEPTATVLRAAAARAREETGYRLGAPADPPPVEGPVPTLDEAVELAQRARGPRRRPASGWESLTPTERSVVQLAAQGLTNPEIGTRLYIGRGTVKTHLAHVYAKLGVANRTELARYAASLPEG
ncbi:helix-turn-helix transcriptional regulator [Pseudonocardia sp. CA-107938]|uniref:helix-turn-helix transcriptional regulator n=1 Tax=Pseudonocardia sp. CA-107938 TaxID=3240021 RepID=UPI003D8EB98F